jgi:hypothetical protein
MLSMCKALGSVPRNSPTIKYARAQIMCIIKIVQPCEREFSVLKPKKGSHTIRAKSTCRHRV